ncbi:MAG: hypothetical protein PHU80_11270, partial [Kiritimatiellae bacterium]|nr:hypothetical protein [Kiritimatiellia bacterium]
RHLSNVTIGAGGGRAARRKEPCRAERGDVLLEYVLLTMVIILPLVGISVGLVNVGGKSTFSPGGAVEGEDFGLLGNAFVERYRMVMSGIALPLP